MNQDTPLTNNLFYITPKFKLPVKWAFFIIIILTAAVLFHFGIRLHDPILFLFTNLWGNYKEFDVDPLWGEYLPNLLPPFFKFIAPIYDIPFSHFIIGLSTKFFLVTIYFLIAWKVTGNLFASTMATTLMFGLGYLRLGEYDIFNLRFPTGLAGNELRVSAYLSFRQIGMVFALIGVLFFLEKRFIWCSFVLAAGMLIHSANIINFFICFSAALALCALTKKEKKFYIKGFFKLTVPFTICIIPYFLKLQGPFNYIEPISFEHFWNVVAANEADDISLLYYLKFKTTTMVSWLGMTFLAIFLHFLNISKKPINRESIKKFLSETNDVLFPLFSAVLFITGFVIIWELILISFLPDFINDLISKLSLRRTTSISSLISIAIIGMTLSRIIAFILQTAYLEITGTFPSIQLKHFSQTSGELSLALLLSIFVFINTTLIDRKNGRLLSEPQTDSRGFPTWVNWQFEEIKAKFTSTFLVFDHKDYEYFRKTTVQKREYPIYTSTDGTVLPFSSYADICRWIQKNTKTSAAFFHPTYTHEFRECAIRQGFLSVQQDGIMAVYNRKYATIYLKRFIAIHKGITESQLPGLAKNKWGSENSIHGVWARTVGEPKTKAFEVLRQKYLSISESDLKRLKTSYPGYDYFLTESIHKLPYPIAYQNKHFTLYRLLEETPNTEF